MHIASYWARFRAALIVKWSFNEFLHNSVQNGHFVIFLELEESFDPFAKKYVLVAKAPDLNFCSIPAFFVGDVSGDDGNHTKHA